MKNHLFHLYCLHAEQTNTDEVGKCIRVAEKIELRKYQSLCISKSDKCGGVMLHFLPMLCILSPRADVACSGKPAPPVSPVDTFYMVSSQEPQTLSACGISQEKQLRNSFFSVIHFTFLNAEHKILTVVQPWQESVLMQQHQLMGTHLAMLQLKYQPHFEKDILGNGRHLLLYKLILQSPTTGSSQLQSPGRGENSKARAREVNIFPQSLWANQINLPAKRMLHSDFLTTE